MSNDKMSDELQIAIRRDPEYTQPSAEVAQLRLQVESLTKDVGTLERLLAPAEAEADQLRLQLQAAQAELDQWRRAVRWRNANYWELRLWLKTGPIELGYVREGKDWLGEPVGWMAETDEGVPVSGLPDRDTACRKVCELLGLPVVLPEGVTESVNQHPAAIDVEWADKPRYPYRIAKCRKCERPIASSDDAELTAAGWEKGEDSGRWYCPKCCG